MKVLYNTTNYPYYKIKFNNTPYTEIGFNKHIKDFHNMFNLCIEKNGKMILIIDIKDLSIPPIIYIQKQIKFMKDNKLLSKEYIAETIFITSAITKRILDILFIYEKPVSPYIIFDNEDQAITYLKDNVIRFGKILELDNESIKNKSINKENYVCETLSNNTLSNDYSMINKIKNLLIN